MKAGRARNSPGVYTYKRRQVWPGLPVLTMIGLFERGVALRHPGSMEELARLLAEGRLVEKDTARALKLSRDGAKLGHKGAQSLLLELEAQAQHSPKKTDKS